MNRIPDKPMQQALLEVHDWTVALGNGTRLVDEVSFELYPGETLALLGESGCGKSMTALSLLRLLPDGVRIAGGTAHFNGEAVHALPEREMRRLRGRHAAMIFQEPGLSLNPVLTVGEQIGEVLALHHGMQGDAARNRAVELLQLVGIPDAVRRLSEYPFQFSGGMKQRVMIAIALAGQPEVLIADEPTTALDVTIQAQVLQLLHDLQVRNRMSMLLITHDLGVVAQTAHRVAVMYAGQIVELATREQLFARPAHPYTRKLFAALPDHARRGNRLEAIAGTVPPMHALPKGCRFAPRCDRAWARCHSEVPSWFDTEEGQGVRCHLYDDPDRVEAASGAEYSAVPDETVKVATHAGSPLLQVTDLQVHFPIRKGLLQRTVGWVKAVDGVSLEIAPGRTVALVGESGCGKTTAGKALLQLIRPTGGQVQFMGQVPTLRDAGAMQALRAGMQMVFQDPYASLNPKMRIAEILEEGMTALGIGGGSGDRAARIDALLEQVGLLPSAKWRYPHEFSGGQRQRIAIARALAVRPKLLICDEPTSALDVSVQAQILNLLKSLQQELGISYLFITHNLSVVEYLAHEVCVMYLGRIVERGSVETVMTHPAHPYTQALLSAVPRIERTQAIAGISGDMPSPAHPPQGCHFHPRCPQAMPVCRQAYPPAFQRGEQHAVHCYLYAQAG